MSCKRASGKEKHFDFSKIIFEDGWSATKWIAAGVVANLLVQGLLKLDEQVTHYVPEMKGTAYDDATIRQCLDMRSGVAWDNKSEGEKNTWNRYRRANGFLARKLEDEKPHEGEPEDAQCVRRHVT